MKPKTPLINIYNHYWLDIIDNSSIDNLNYAYAYDLTRNRDYGIWYSLDGNIWRLKKHSGKFENSLFTRIIYWLYPKRYPVETTWTRVREYKLDELKSDIIKCVKKDDDILTQFIPADLFISKITSAKEFSEIKGIIYRYSFKVEDEQAIWDELKELGLLE